MKRIEFSQIIGGFLVGVIKTVESFNKYLESLEKKKK